MRHATPLEAAVENYAKQWRRLTEEAKTARKMNMPLTARVLRRQADLIDRATEAEIAERVR